MVVYDDTDVLELNKEHCAELSKLLPAETLSHSDASKKKVIERVTSGSASLVHFLVHGTPGGMTGHVLGLMAGGGKKAGLHAYI